MTTKKAYTQKKRDLVRVYQNAIKSGRPVALRKKTTNLFRARSQGKVARLDVTQFDDVIAIDKKRKIATVEGMATYETIVAETLKHDLMPAVVPQLKTITLGGAVTGVGIESSSFRYGFPHETVLSMEILTGEGKVVETKPTGANKDLFFGFANSYGSLGYALSLTISLVPVKKYVHLRHLRYASAKQYFADMQKISNTGAWAGEKIDFVDGMIYGRNHYYITIGQMVASAPYTSDYTYKNIYYKSITQRPEDYLTIADYIWRWDTDWFWCTAGLGVQKPWVRRMLGKSRLRSDTYMKLFRIESKYGVKRRLDKLMQKKPKEMVIQDVEIPIENCERFIDYYLKTIGILPAWNCPVRQKDPKRTYPLFKVDTKKLYVNFGFWSSVDAKLGLPHWHNTSLEKKVDELKGKKSLYSDAFYDEKQFWKLYNKSQYKILKNRYDPNMSLKGLYEKTVKRG